jgi:choline-sulfatase
MKRLLVAVAVVGSACAIGPRAPVGVVLITLDTTRADRLSPYGFGNARMPALDRLAREGVVFDQATTVAPLTLPAHTSLLTGLLPPHHRVRDNASAPLDPEQATLAEILAARGYRTAAFVGSAVLDPDRGLRQGFQEYGGISRNTVNRLPPLGRGLQRPAGAVMDDALRWLATVNDAPFFLWTHLYDPHRPYEAPEPFASRHDPYVAEIAYADSQIARLLEALDRQRLLDRVVVIVVADHGESLGDHGERDHGVFLYEGVLRVPMIMRAPGIRPARVASVVRLTDVMPTVLDLLGVPAPPLDGVSLLATLNGPPTDLDAYAESLYPQRHGWAPLFSLRSDRFKFIDAPRPELYDLRLDPFEQRNIIEQRQELAAALRTRLRTLEQSKPSTGARAPVDAELHARLAALGYLAGRAPEMHARDLHLPDPKACAGVFESGRCR